MKKQIIFSVTTAIALMLAVSFSALAQTGKKPPLLAFIPVFAIVDVPSTATVGVALTLTGRVLLPSATNQTIKWSVVSAGTTGATINGNTLNTTAEGTVKVRATIINGASTTSDYIQDFEITVSTLVEILIPIPDWHSAAADETAPTSQIAPNWKLDKTTGRFGTLFFNGSGSGSSPYLITNAADLAKFSELIDAGTAPYADVNTFYRLTDHITLPSVPSGSSGNHIPIGTEANPFRGNFDGNGKIISNLTINLSSNYVGLFGHITGKAIMNLGLRNVKIKGNQFTGGIVGFLNGNANVTSCFVTGAISSVVQENACFGGIAGGITPPATVSHCYTNCRITGSGISGGGIAGYNWGTVNYCYTLGTIAGKSDVGGIVGSNAGAVKNCLALNSSVNKTAPGSDAGFGRIAGDNYKLLFQNAAWEGMKVNGSLVTGSAIDKNGLNVNKTQMTAPNFFTIYCPTPPWSVLSGKLPGLFGKTVEMPPYLN